MSSKLNKLVSSELSKKRIVIFLEIPLSADIWLSNFLNCFSLTFILWISFIHYLMKNSLKAAISEQSFPFLYFFTKQKLLCSKRNHIKFVFGLDGSFSTKKYRSDFHKIVLINNPSRYKSNVVAGLPLLVLFALKVFVTSIWNSTFFRVLFRSFFQRRPVWLQPWLFILKPAIWWIGAESKIFSIILLRRGILT